MASSDDDPVASPTVLFFVMDQIFATGETVLFKLVHPEFPIHSHLFFWLGDQKLTVTVLDIFPWRSTTARSSLGADNLVLAGVFARYIMFQKLGRRDAKLVASVDIFII